MDRDTRTLIKKRITELTTENTAFYRDHNIMDRHANDKAILELNKLIQIFN